MNIVKIVFYHKISKIHNGTNPWHIYSYKMLQKTSERFSSTICFLCVWGKGGRSFIYLKMLFYIKLKSEKKTVHIDWNFWIRAALSCSHSAEMTSPLKYLNKFIYKEYVLVTHAVFRYENVVACAHKCLSHTAFNLPHTNTCFQSTFFSIF